MTTTISGDSTSTFGGNVDVTGNVITDAPAFSASLSAGQSVTTSTWTKIIFDIEDYDTNSNFTSSTFTPTVAGYYQINLNVRLVGSAYLSAAYGAVYKNGSLYKREVGVSTSSTYINLGSATGSYLIYMNGTTDYLEFYGYNVCATSPVIHTGTIVSGYLARAV